MIDWGKPIIVTQYELEDYKAIGKASGLAFAKKFEQEYLDIVLELEG